MKTLHEVIEHIRTLAILDPLAQAQASLDIAKAKFDIAKTEFDAASTDANATVLALIKKANENNRASAEKAQERLGIAKNAYETAQASLDAATKLVHELEKTHKKVSITGADYIQMGCAYCAVNGIKYEQNELVAEALRLTGKETVGQYGYFRRISSIAKLLGITVSITINAN
jgi:multidrug efflux pump subunit AcrA (membrane-fusion protein)